MFRGVGQRRKDFFTELLGTFGVFLVFQPAVESVDQSFGQAGQLAASATISASFFATMLDGAEHTETVFGGIFKEGAAPSRAVTILVGGVRHGGSGTTQMEEQPVALAISIRSPKKLGDQLHVGVSPQPAHAPEEFKQRLLG